MGSEVIVNVKDANADDVVVPDTSANSPNTGYLGIDGSMDVNTNSSGSMPVAVPEWNSGCCPSSGSPAACPRKRRKSPPFP